MPTNHDHPCFYLPTHISISRYINPATAAIAAIPIPQPAAPTARTSPLLWLPLDPDPPPGAPEPPLPAVPPPVVEVVFSAVPLDTDAAFPLSAANPMAVGLYRNAV